MDYCCFKLTTACSLLVSSLHDDRPDNKARQSVLTTTYMKVGLRLVFESINWENNAIVG